jgi:Protein of unknown function (DUF2892)
MEDGMDINEGTADRIARVMAGVLIISLTFFLEGNLRWLGFIGFIPLLTGVIGTCPLYSMLGMNTCGAKNLRGD